MTDELFEQALGLAKVGEGETVKMALYRVVTQDLEKFGLTDREDAKLKINKFLSKRNDIVLAVN